MICVDCVHWDDEDQSLDWDDWKRLHERGKASDEPWLVGRIQLKGMVHHE